jgi:hypothetical protein
VVQQITKPQNYQDYASKARAPRCKNKRHRPTDSFKSLQIIAVKKPPGDLCSLMYLWIEYIMRSGI